MAAHWTEAEDAELTRLWLAGTPVRDIAVALHAGMERVTGRRFHLGLPPRPTTKAWSAEDVATLKRLHATGAPYSAIAKALGTTRNAISGAASRHGLARSAEVAKANNRAACVTRVVVRVKPLAKPLSPPKPTPMIRPKAQKVKPRSAEIAIAPRPWITRKFGECAWPVDGEGADTRSCCNPTNAWNYCPQHLYIATQGRAA